MILSQRAKRRRPLGVCDAPMKRNVPLKPWASPLFRWAGSKRRLLPVLMSTSAQQVTRRYIEPFAGSACLFFALRPQKAILGDINSELIQAYDTVRDHPRLVYRQASAWPNTRAFYYKLRSKSPATLDAVSRAARFVYLNRHCFNGVYRINRAGEFNVPIGIRTGEIPPERHFYRCALALRGVNFVVGDFQRSVDLARRGDFVYLDPPYAVDRRPTHGEYGYDAFDRAALPRLKGALSHLDAVGAVFLLSYAYQRHFARELRRWHMRRVRVHRHVAGFARHRHGVYELLVSNQPLFVA